MRKFLSACTFLLLIAIAAGFGTVQADNESSRRNAAQKFATLPDGVRFPEGITANPANGDIYVATFDAPPNNQPNRLLRFDRHGKLLGQLNFGNTPLLGLEFDRVNQKVYITNVGNFAGVDSKIQRVAADLSNLEDVAIIPGIGAPAQRTVNNPDGSHDTITFGSGARVPNALAFDSKGSLYVSDSFQGAIFRIANPQSCAPSCIVETFKHDPLLATAGFPPFGANGLAFNKDETALFIANTGDDRVLRLELISGLKEVSVFVESINGADGIAFDHRGRLWVAANQNDEIVGLNANGRVIARLGEFQGINKDGTPDGLLFPASLVIVGNEIFVTNLALPLNNVSGDEPEEEVSRYTISRIKLPPGQ